MEILVKDEGEDGFTTFDAAMLVNVKGSVEGIQTELYDSGASRHMSPYRDHFEGYTPIVLKSITAADKHYFQAIGKGNLCIKIPNGSRTMTVLKGCSPLPRHGPYPCIHRQDHFHRLQSDVPRTYLQNL